MADTSALVAVLFGEAERDSFYSLLDTSSVVMSAGNVIELMRVVARRKPRLVQDAKLLLDRFDVFIASVDEVQVGYAVEGQTRFGTG